MSLSKKGLSLNEGAHKLPSGNAKTHGQGGGGKA